MFYHNLICCLKGKDELNWNKLIYELESLRKEVNNIKDDKSNKFFINIDLDKDILISDKVVEVNLINYRISSNIYDSKLCDQIVYSNQEYNLALIK